MTAPRKRRVFPFTAVIGQEEMKLALQDGEYDSEMNEEDLEKRIVDLENRVSVLGAKKLQQKRKELLHSYTKG